MTVTLREIVQGTGQNCIEKAKVYWHEVRFNNNVPLDPQWRKLPPPVNSRHWGSFFPNSSLFKPCASPICVVAEVIGAFLGFQFQHLDPRDIDRYGIGHLGRQHFRSP